MSRLQQFQTILKQQDPFTTLSWRFLFAKPGSPEYLHRFAFFRQNNRQPIIFRIIAALFVYLRWYIYGAFLSSWRTLKLHKKLNKDKPVNHKSTISKFIRLLTLTYGYAIPARCYDQMELHDTPSSNWLDYVYDFQTSCWHSAYINFKDTSQIKDLHLLQDKHRFEQQLRDSSQTTVKTLIYLDRTQTLSLKDLSKLPDYFFIKPNNANRSIGCWRVKQISSNTPAKHEDHIEFQIENQLTGNVWSQVSLDHLNSLFKQRDYLIQQCENSPANLTKLIGDKPAVIRIITFYHNDKIELTSCYLNAPQISKLPKDLIFHVDPIAGVCRPAFKFSSEVESNIKEAESVLTHHTTQQWRIISQLCRNAHKVIPNLFSVGWDIALTARGPVIVEGNSHWATDLHQFVDGTPLLNSKVNAYYLDRIASL